MASDVSRGLAFAVGVLPAALLGMPPARRDRRTIAVTGALVGAPMALGALLANLPWLAVATLLGAGIGVVLLTRRSRLGRIAMVLGLPMVGIGFSYTDASEALGIAALMIVGSIYACIVSLLWPDRPAAPRPPDPPAPSLEYGIRLGVTGATAAAIGFLLDLDHVGWACGAALLVMRPSAEMQQIRSVGRLCSVTIGALVAVVIVRGEPGELAYSVAAVAALAAAAATHGSRWYVTSAFTTFLVFLLLLASDPDAAASRFGERVGETLLGVGLACLFGLLLPRFLPAPARPPTP
jgi:uncharacterized membrane protein YccC